MAKVAITMTFGQALLTKFKSRLVQYGIEFEEHKSWATIHPGFKQITKVQYVVEDYYVAILEMNSAMDDKERVGYEVEEYV